MKKLHLFAFALVIGAILIFTGYTLTHINPNLDVITAMEGKSEADNLAQKWNDSAVLVAVYGYGNSGEWRYSYSSNHANINLSTGFDVFIYANGTNVTEERVHPPSPDPISNWNIDSDKAEEIARANPEIKDWLREYNNANLQSMVLTANQTTSAWGIAWNDPGFMDDPHTSAIGIDATTGVVIDVYVQG